MTKQSQNYFIVKITIDLRSFEARWNNNSKTDN